MMALKDLPREILELIFWAIECPLTAQHYFEQVLVGERSLGTQSEFFRFVVHGKRYKSSKRLEYLRQEIPDEVIMYKFAQRSLLSTRPSIGLLLVGKFGKLRLTQ